MLFLRIPFGGDTTTDTLRSHRPTRRTSESYAFALKKSHDPEFSKYSALALVSLFLFQLPPIQFPQPPPSTNAKMVSTIPVTQITRSDLDATKATIEAMYSNKEVQVYVRPILAGVLVLLVSQPNTYSIHLRLLG